MKSVSSLPPPERCERTSEARWSQRLRTTLVWATVIALLVAVFALYGQHALLLQWVEMKLC